MAGMSAHGATRSPRVRTGRQQVLDGLRRHGPTTIPALASESGLNVETVRHHVRALVEQGVVVRRGERRAGHRGRPELEYGLAQPAGSMDGAREGILLRALVRYLMDTGHEHILSSFRESYTSEPAIEEQRARALARVAPLRGRARVREAARILSEVGSMIGGSAAGPAPGPRPCLCSLGSVGPLRDPADTTATPCRAEVRFVNELLDGRPVRLNYVRPGDAARTRRARIEAQARLLAGR